jgi:hypothetical protein
MRRAKKLADPEDDPLDREIDFPDSYPNPFVALLGDLQNMVILAPDVLEVFPNSTAVNAALRELVVLRRKVAAAPQTKRARQKARAKKKRV